MKFLGKIEFGHTADANLYRVAADTIKTDDTLTTAGNVGIKTDTPNFASDVAGDQRIRSTNAQRFGGTGATDYKFSIQYNTTEDSLDFIYG